MSENQALATQANTLPAPPVGTVALVMSDELIAQLRTWWGKSKALAVTDATTAEQADALVGQGAKLLKQIEAAAKPPKALLDRWKEIVLNRERAYKDPVAAQLTRLKAEIATFVKAREDAAKKAADEARRQREAEAAAVPAVVICQKCHEPKDEMGECGCVYGQVVDSTAPPAKPAPAPQPSRSQGTLLPMPERAPVLANTSVVRKWLWKVDDPKNLPAEFQVVTVTANEEMIDAVVKKLGEKASIPGVTVWEQSSTNLKGRR